MANWFDQYFGFAPKANEQDGVWSFGIPQGQAPDVPLWPSPQMPPQSDDPFERAAQRTRQSVQPQGGRTEGMATTLPEDFLIPKTPLDYALYATMGPFRLPAKAAMLGIGAAMGSEPAEAGLLSKIVGGIKAWHGSPHDFDKFDLGKIGTGEGAQAYGHGLYAAEQPLTAESYISNAKWKYGPTKAETAYERVNSPTLERGLDNEGWSKLNAQRGFWERVVLGRSPRQIIMDAKLNPDQYGANELAYINSLNPDKFTRKGGHMYEVNINARPEQFLDWDKPLKQQTVDLSPFARAKEVADFTYQNPTGGDLYRSMSLDHARNTEVMREAGIPGIKYLDQGSRNAGQGSSNYVVFDDKLIDILKKYGITLPGAGAAIAASREQNN